MGGGQKRGAGEEKARKSGVPTPCSATDWATRELSVISLPQLPGVTGLDSQSLSGINML